MVAIACLAIAHGVQAALGHDWFVAHAFVLALPISVFAGGVLALRAPQRSRLSRAADWAMTSSTLIVLMLVPQWIEGEFGYRDGVTLQALRECGLPTMLAAYFAMYLFTVVAWARLLSDALRRYR